MQQAEFRQKTVWNQSKPHYNINSNSGRAVQPKQLHKDPKEQLETIKTPHHETIAYLTTNNPKLCIQGFYLLSMSCLVQGTGCFLVIFFLQEMHREQ
jgi:hypothetical protein